METPPNFDSLKGDARFFVKSSERICGSTQESSVYDHFLAKWFVVNYPYEPVEPEVVERDIARFADDMGSHNILSVDKDGKWTTTEGRVDYEYYIEYEVYDGPASGAIRQEELDITGAVGPGTLVIGMWASVFKLCIGADVVKRVRTAIDYLGKLRGHQHVVQLEHVVVDRDNFVRGYTLPFIPGGTLEARKQLRISWFLELAQTADDFNFIYNFVHCDLFPRNMVVNSMGTLQIIDFEQANCVSNATPDYDAACIIISAYQAITKKETWTSDDDPYTALERVERWVNKVLSPDADWSPANGVTLSAHPLELREFLCRWRDARKIPGYQWGSFMASEKGLEGNSILPYN